MPPPRRVNEQRFTASFAQQADLLAFRKALIDLAGGFTEVSAGRTVRYIVGVRGAQATKALRKLLEDWQGRTRAKRIELEDRTVAADGDEIYFLLPLLRNPDPQSGARRPLFTNEELLALRRQLATLFHFRSETVLVYGEWRSAAGEPVGDQSFLLRVPRRSRMTLSKLRRVIRNDVLANPSCDQDCIYLSSRWQGEFVYPAR